MAASKDVFEPHVFASNTFAAGAFRGLGVTQVSPLVGTWSSILDIRSQNTRLDIRSRNARLEVKSANKRLEI